MTNKKEKEALRKKLYELYEENEDKDKNNKYTILMSLFDRVQKVLSYQQAAFAKIDKRITQIQRAQNVQAARSHKTKNK